MTAGADENEIVRDILDCRADQQSIGEEYVKFLKQKYE
jgi:hypothetical protein